MDQTEIIKILQLTSIILAAGFGVASAVTDTRNEKGQLTRWGVIAVIGIVVSNSFSFIQTFLEQRKQMQEEIVQMEKTRIQDSIKKEEYLEQIQLLYNNLNKSDSSLQQQFQIQAQTSNVLKKMDKSLSVQDNILNKSEALNVQQKNAAEKIDQTLNPLFPMAMDLTLEIKPDRNTPELQKFTDFIINSYTMSQKYRDSIGITSYDGNNFSFSKQVQKQFQNFLRLRNLMIFFERLENGKTETMYCFVPPKDLQNFSSKDNIIVSYNLSQNSYNIMIKEIPIKMEQRKGTGFKSTTQLQNSKMKIMALGMPGYVESANITYKFPPDLSVIYKIDFNGKISNDFSPVFGYVLDYSTNAVKLEQ